MGLFRRKEKPEERADPGREVDASDSLLRALISGTDVDKTILLQIPAVRGCLEKIAGTVCRLPIKLYRKVDGKVEEITEDARLRLLNKETGDTLNADEFWRTMLEDYYLGRGAYAYIRKNGIGEYEGLHYVEEEKVSVLKNYDPILKSYSIMVMGKTYHPFEFLKLHRRTKDGAEGIPLWQDNPLIFSVAYNSFVFEEKLVKKGGNKIANMKAKYAKAEVNVDKICKVLEGHQIQLLKDAAMLDQMYQLNLTYYKELSMYIAAGKKRLESFRAKELSMYILAGKEKIQQVKEQELPELIKRAEESGLPEDTQKAKDLAELCNRFEKKIYDLELTRTISMQMAPQIRLIQSNDTAMSEKIQSTLVNTIPLWKSQMVLAIGVEHSAQAAKAQREVTDMTNTLLKKNAETLKLATVETAKESERGIVDIETLKQTNETLISTLDEVLQIQEDGRNKRREAEAELTQIETTMRNKLMEMSRTK